MEFLLHALAWVLMLCTGIMLTHMTGWIAGAMVAEEDLPLIVRICAFIVFGAAALFFGYCTVTILTFPFMFLAGAAEPLPISL